MTIATTTFKVTANGNGVATNFSFNPIAIYKSANLQVTKVGTDDSETLLTEGTGTTQYSVSVSSYPGTGSINYPADALGTKLQTGEKIVIKRLLEEIQETNLSNQGPYNPEVLEQELDKIICLIQQIQEEVDRSVKTTVGSDVNPDDLIQDLEDNAAQVAANTALVQAAVTSINLIQATEAQIGIAKVATQAQTNTGTDDTTIVTPKKLKNSLSVQQESLIVAVTGEGTALTATTNVFRFRMPYAFTLTSIKASLNTAQTSGSIVTVDVNETGSTILSTKLTFDNTESTTVTAATPPVISDASLAADALISIDVDQIGDSTAKGLKVTFIGHQ